MVKEIFALLTRIRIPGASMDLGRAAQMQDLFPLVGITVGTIVAVAAIALDHLLGKGMELVVGAMVLGLMYLLNGMMHIEGMADFADGLMASGTQDRKRAAMKDVHCGVGGVFAVVLYLIVLYSLVVTISSHASSELRSFLPWPTMAAFGFIIAEMAGKLAVVTAAYIGPSSHPGMGSVFADASSARVLLVAVAIATIVAALLTGILFPIVLSGTLVGIWVAMRARKEFGGVSGDVFGAANEVGRLVALFGWVLLI